MGANFPDRHWYRLSALSLVLWPVSLVYGLLVALRRLAYASGALRAVRLPVAVIVVGNIVVGGTGKTPLVLALAEKLKANGRVPGIWKTNAEGTRIGSVSS